MYVFNLYIHIGLWIVYIETTKKNERKTTGKISFMWAVFPLDAMKCKKGFHKWIRRYKWSWKLFGSSFFFGLSTPLSTIFHYFFWYWIVLYGDINIKEILQAKKNITAKCFFFMYNKGLYRKFTLFYSKTGKSNVNNRLKQKLLKNSIYSKANIVIWKWIHFRDLSFHCVFCIYMQNVTGGPIIQLKIERKYFPIF